MIIKGPFSIALHKNIYCGHRGDSNEYQQHMFLRRNNENYPKIVLKYPPYLFYWSVIFFFLIVCIIVCKRLTWTDAV